MKTKNLILVLGLIAFSIGNTFATNRIVAKSGGNYTTIQAGVNAAVAGDTVIVKAGTYNEMVTIPTSGTATQRITIKGESGAIIDGTGLAFPTNGSPCGLIFMDSKSYVTIQGFQIMNAVDNSSSVFQAGIFIVGSGTGVQILNNKVSNIVNSLADSGCHGIGIYGTSTTPMQNLLVDGNEVFNCQTGWSESMVLNGNINGFTVTNNIVHDNNNIGIDFIGFEGTCSDAAQDQARNGTCTNNYVYNINSYGNAAYGTDMSAAGIYVDGGRKIIIDRNSIYNCNIGVEVASEHNNKVTDSVVVRDNFISNCNVNGIAFGGYDTDRGWTINCQFLNNTLYNNATDPTNGDGQIMMQKSHDNIIKNNIIHLGTQTGDAVTNWFSSSYTYNNVFDYNLYYSTAGTAMTSFAWQNNWYQSFAEWKTATGYDTHSLFIDPKLVSTTDYHIQATSAAVNAGDPTFVPGTTEKDVDGQTRVSGSRVDIGADEIQTAAALIESMKASDDITIAPNPLKSESLISFDNPQDKPYTLIITNMAGSVIERVTDITSNKIVLKKGNLSTGMYFVLLIGERSFKKVLIVQ